MRDPGESRDIGKEEGSRVPFFCDRMAALGWEAAISNFVMLNLFQHRWPDPLFHAAPKETAGHEP
ncbi:hypothetical protein [Sphingopyxis sp.]|uniref:hypothetical protein n=1 Tax=Sphingopyxis sp. TaxID=1908224 RepID=UPI001D85E353|nr:hypothetical protein [Sphingopyxis sp.]MBW8294906.1 hypothetical protein [Sphingopyxis sp.]